MLEIVDLTVNIDGDPVVRDANLVVPSSGVTALMGPSGSGKTTLLRAIAGLQSTARGVIRWNGVPVTDLRPDERPFGLMFQDYALFPHRDVADNIGFGLKMEGLPRAEIKAEVGRLLELVGLPGFGKRSVTELSGGEQQRVALARALAPRPGLLMLDEPLGSLDRTLRDRLVGEMRDIFARLEPAVLYVTHDQQEAFELADAVAVMDAGHIVRSGTPHELWTDPETSFTAGFLGFEDIFDAVIEGDHADLGWTAVPVTGPGTKVVLLPGAVALDQHGVAGGTVLDARYAGGSYTLTVEVEPGAVVHVASADRIDQGVDVRFSIDPDRVVTID